MNHKSCVNALYLDKTIFVVSQALQWILHNGPAMGLDDFDTGELESLEPELGDMTETGPTHAKY